jgi:ElaB/YqjD/DUF883 family membrane-anchored ribosome-binding protein
MSDCASNAIRKARRAVCSIRRKAIRTSRVADGALHSKPYQGVFIGLMVGVVLGFAAACFKQTESN